MSRLNTTLLSICIPTYNRADFLNSCLASIFAQLKEDMEVEIIVSNNHSSDHTNEILKQYNNPKFKCYEQDTNIGFARNVMASVKYASGDFCWIIGDDDFLPQGALAAILNLIRQHGNNIDFFYASVKGIHISEYNSYDQPFDTRKLGSLSFVDTLEYEPVRFERLIDPAYSIIFLGELMASIFRREYWLQFKTSDRFEAEFLETLETTYPHSVVLANTFFGKEALYVKTPVIYSLDGAREWWDKLGYILIVQVKNLLDLYESKGLPKDILHRCQMSYLRMTLKYFVQFAFNRKSKYREKISLSRYFIFLLKHPFLLISYFGGALKNRLGTNSKKNIEK